jgi:hypothetical protein
VSDFKGLVKCLNCNKNFKRKLERKKSILVCSGYANYGKQFCAYNPISEEELILAISKHLAVLGRRIEGEIKGVVDKIEVKNGVGYTIYYKDGSKSIVDNSNDYGVKYQI